MAETDPAAPWQGLRDYPYPHFPPVTLMRALNGVDLFARHVSFFSQHSPIHTRPHYYSHRHPHLRGSGEPSIDCTSFYVSFLSQHSLIHTRPHYYSHPHLHLRGSGKPSIDCTSLYVSFLSQHSRYPRPEPQPLIQGQNTLRGTEGAVQGAVHCGWGT